MNHYDLYEEPTQWATDNSVYNLIENLYAYWYHRGLWGSIFFKLFRFLTVSYTWLLLFCITFCIDYQILFQSYNLTKSFTKPLLSTRMDWIFIILFVLCFGLVLYEIYQVAKQIYISLECNQYCQNILMLSNYETETISWSDFLQIIVERQGNTLRYTKPLSHLEIVSILTSHDNFFISLLNAEILDLRLPYLNSFACISSIVYVLLEISLFNWIFTKCSNIQDSIMFGDIEKLTKMLEKRFVICGIVSLIFCPLVMVCTVIYFIFRYGDEIKDRPGTILGLKQWSTLAKWKMRDINELPHLFEERLKNSQTAAQKYVGHFHLHKIGLLADFVAYSTGALIALIIIAELIEVNFITNLNFFGMNGIVWFGLLSGVLTISRGLRVTVRPSSQTINDSMVEMAEITHYLPDHWYGRAHTTHIRDEFNQLFTYTFSIWIMELVSIVSTPFVFLFKLPYCARDIIEFCRTKTEYFENIGYLSTFSMLDLEEFGSMIHDSTVGNEQRNICENNIIIEDYKINQSIINFASQYPLWKTQEIY